MTRPPAFTRVKYGGRLLHARRRFWWAGVRWDIWRRSAYSPNQSTTGLCWTTIE